MEDVVLLGMVFWLAYKASPYTTYLLRDAEIMDMPRSYLLSVEFFADMLDCVECSSMWAMILNFSLVLVAIASYLIHPFLSLPAVGMLLCLAGASWSVDGLYDSDSDQSE